MDLRLALMGMHMEMVARQIAKLEEKVRLEEIARVEEFYAG